jgi:RNA polymerase sigma-70 factor (ECF subfamily)
MQTTALAIAGGPVSPRPLTPANDDASLAAALRSGDPRAAALAWRSLSPLVLSLLGRTVGRGPERQDLCQEVFLRFFARIAELRNPGALRTFLIGICSGVAQNEIRRVARARRRVILTETGDPPELSVGPGSPEARMAVARFYRVIAGVSAEDRALFFTRHVEKRRLPEIAAAMGRSLSTTKRHLARATRRVVGRMRRDPTLSHYVDDLIPARPRAAC